MIMHAESEPSGWVRRYAHLVSTGASLLDLACGHGRHARFFAARGVQVTAVDRDAEALAALAGVAGVRTVEADLEAGTWPLGDARFDAIVVTNYLHRPLFAPIRAALAADGVVIYETFMRGNEQFGRPSNPDFLLAPGELLGAFERTACIAFEQGRIETPRVAVVQRIVAVASERGFTPPRLG